MMSRSIVISKDPVVLVGGGAVLDDALRADLAAGCLAVAADGGAARLLALGRVPDAVIGDMDSLRPEDRAAIPANRLHPIAEQDSTDFDKALRNIDAPLVLAHGFQGGRFDHALAALSVLARRPERRCLLIGGTDVVTLLPPRLSLPLVPGTRVSLYPLGPVAGRSEGLRWPIDGIAFAPDGTVGTSNEATGPVALAVDAPAMLLILPAACRHALQRAVLAAPAGWPVRA